MDYTTRFGAMRPANTEAATVGAYLRDHADKLDIAAIDLGRGPFSAAPAPAVDGRFYWSDDRRLLLRDNGGQLEVVASAPPQEVAALPTTGLFTGLTVDLVVQTEDSGSGRPKIVWRLRYDAAAAAGQRWRPVGECPPLRGELASASTSNEGASDLGLTVAAPIAGCYDVEFHAFAQAQSGGLADIEIVVWLADNSGTITSGKFVTRDTYDGGHVFGSKRYQLPVAGAKIGRNVSAAINVNYAHVTLTLTPVAIGG